MNSDTRPIRLGGRTRPRKFWRFMLRVLVLTPLTLGFALFVALLTAQALYAEEMQQVGDGLRSVLLDYGILYEPYEPGSSDPGFTSPGLPPREQLEAYITPGLSLRDRAATELAFSSPAPSETSRFSPTPSLTPTETPTPTSSETATPTPSVTSTGTLTPSDTPTRTPYPTWTPLPSRTPTRTSTRTRTPTPSRTFTPSVTPTVTNTWDPAIPTYTVAPTSTLVPTNTTAPTATETPISTSCNYSLNTSFENQVVQLINDERQSRGLYAYAVQSQLRAAARVQAADMACNHFTGHTGSDGSSVRDRVTAQGYSWSWIGENYMVSQNPVTAFNWWMNSGPHTANILSPNYTEFGVGYVYSSESDYGGYFVVVFARP
jgi:uncharacterized protein YkwD